MKKEISTLGNILSIWVVLLLLSCSPKGLDLRLQNELNIHIKDESKVLHVKKQGIDSEVGYFVIAKDTFTYDYGQYSYKGPGPVVEDVTNAFKSYYYSKFFEKVNVDAKVQRLFIDSIRIEKIQLLDKDSIGFPFANEGGNIMSSIQFKGKNYWLPSFVKETTAIILKDVDVFFTKSNQRTIYASKNPRTPTTIVYEFKDKSRLTVNTKGDYKKFLSNVEVVKKENRVF